jgi:uroporphyrinogen III methyltransferase/synthase
MAVPAYAGIPVTHRSHTSSFAVVTGHEEPGKDQSSVNWEKISTAAGTLVFLMGVANLPLLVEKLMEHGRPSATPAAAIQWGTRPRQRTVVGTLETIVARVAEAGLGAPSVIVVGEVVALRERLAWFDRLPLFGKNIVVTRSRRQASAMSERLRDLGANPLELPTIRIVPPSDEGPLVEALARLNTYDWIVLSSANGAESAMEHLISSGRDARAFGSAKICAIGPGTAAKLSEYHLRADLVPEKFIAEGALEALVSVGIAGARILFPRAALAREVLPDGLRAAGAHVDVVEAYATKADNPQKDEIEKLFQEGEVHAVTFTSSSTVTSFFEIMGPRALEYLDSAVTACIGPITAETARQKGARVDVIAAVFTIEGLIDALCDHFGS